MKNRIIILSLMLVAGYSLQAQNVGIGVATPVTKLDIYGDIRIGTNRQDTLTGRIRYNPTDFIFEGNDSLNWVPLHTRWTRANGNNIYRPTGNVGINYPDCTGQFGIKSVGITTPNIEIKRDQTGVLLKATDLNDATHPFLIEMDRLSSDHAYVRLAVSTDYSNQLTIQRNGKIGFGTNNPGNYTGLESALVEFADNDPQHSDWGLRLASANATSCPSIYFAKSGGIITSPTVISDNHRLGGFQYMGFDGVKFVPAGAMRSEVDGAIGGINDMPGCLIFETRSDGTTGALTERMRISNRGYVGIGTDAPAGILDVRGGTASSGNGTHIYFYAQNGNDGWWSNYNGGNIILYPGAKNGLGTAGGTGINTTTPSSNLHVNGSVSTAIKSITGNYTCSSADHTILVNTSNYITITLPAAATATGRIYYIKKIATGSNTVTIDPAGSEKIDKASNYTAINSQWEAAIIHCDGTGWYVTSKK